MKTKLIITAALIAVFFLALCLMPQPEPDPRVEQLQAEISQLREQGEALRVELEDVKSVQGYLAYEKDWRSKR